MLDYPLTATLRELDNHFERVYIDDNIFSISCKPRKMPWGFVCPFSEHLGKAQRYHDVNLRILRQQEHSSRILSELIQEIDLYTTEEIVVEYEYLISHISHQLKWLRNNSNGRKGKKQKSLEQIFENHKIIRDQLKVEPCCEEYASLLKSRRLHLPRVLELTKITQQVKEECSDGDASLVSAALSFGGRVAIATHDMDISNLVFNYGQDLRRAGDFHQVVVYFLILNPENELSFNFSSNDQFTYRSL